MPAIQVRDFSQEIYNRIKQEAKESGRSIMQQTKHIVIQHFANQDNESSAVAAHPLPAYASPKASTDTRSPEHTGSQNPFFEDEANAIAQRSMRREALFARIASREYPDAARELDSEWLVRQLRDER